MSDDIERARLVWAEFAEHVLLSMRAGERLAAAYRNADLAGARAHTRVAIEHADAVRKRAKTLMSSDKRWKPVCQAMLRAGDLHAAGLRRLPLPPGPAMFDEIGRQWSIAVLEMRTLYAQLGGDPGQIRAFVEMVAN